VPGGAAALPFDRDFNTTSDNQAAYGQVVLGILKGTRLMAGARYDQARQDRFDNISGTASDSQTDRKLTKRFGITQDLSPNITAYASYAESFNPVDAQTVSGDFLDPETGKGYELGVKTEWLNRRLGATVAVFRQDLDKQPIPDRTAPPTVDASISGGLNRTYGLEIEVTGSPAPGFQVGLSAAWLNSKYVNPEDPNYGLRPYDSVDWMGSIFAAYEIQGGDWKGLGFNATVVAEGKRSASDSFNETMFGPGTTELFLPGYERLDLGVTYRGFDHWRLAFTVRNVTDEKYIERFRDVSGSNYFGSPRAALFRAEYRFF
jgi:outer membrane receptor protein involved in Fe transport